MKYLVYYNNGLVETNVLIIAKDAVEATEIFKNDMGNDKDFINGNCLGKCEWVRTVEVLS